VALRSDQRGGHLLQAGRDPRQRVCMPGQRGSGLTHFGGFVDRMLAAIAPITRVGLLLGLVEIVVGLCDPMAGLVKRIGELVDRLGVTGLQLVIEFPRIPAGRPAQLTNIKVGLCY